jgi:hypothetical protein
LIAHSTAADNLSDVPAVVVSFGCMASATACVSTRGNRLIDPVWRPAAMPSLRASERIMIARINRMWLFCYHHHTQSLASSTMLVKAFVLLHASNLQHMAATTAAVC